MDSQADTYIEACFEQKCGETFRYSEKIVNHWRNDKEYYCSCTKITGFDFQHYSMHDESHSISILDNIAMVLGKERVKELNASDLWLLLESAYCHDIGMSLTYKQLCDLWKEKNFKDFLMTNLKNETQDIAKAKYIYGRLDRLLHNESKFTAAVRHYEMEDYESEYDEVLERNCWPVALERYLMLLYTEYVRKMHPAYSRKIIQNYGDDEMREEPGKRMYDVVSDVAFLHGENFEEIFVCTDSTEKGFGKETMHPRFAAAMLRLGDLLDMDSNRFNMRMIKHMGIMPAESMLHLKKHKSLRHLSITQYQISARAESDEFDVCKTAGQWFQLLEEEVNNLICCWNQIVPEQLIGCRLNRCKLEIYYKGKPFDASQQTRFQADPTRVFEILIGENIYASRLDFIREYLQNAIDASKMSIWLWLKEQKDLLERHSQDEISPFEIGTQLYEQYVIDLVIDIDWAKGKLYFSIKDRGIGMEKECVEGLSNVAGNSWKKRSDYAAEISDMPVWLRPTGGFGIGIQSAFMIADQVEFLTKSRKEASGCRICVENSRKSGRVSRYECDKSHAGTDVTICIPLMTFLQEVNRSRDNLQLYEISGNVFDREQIAGVIQKIVEKYVRETARYSIVPINLRCAAEKADRLGMRWDEYSIIDHVKKLDVLNKNCNIRYGVRGESLFLWDVSKAVLVIYAPKTERGGWNKCYYHGVWIGRETNWADNSFDTALIYYGNDVQQYLTINRDSFTKEQRKQYFSDLQYYRYCYAEVFQKCFERFREVRLQKGLIVQTLVLQKLGMISKDDRINEKMLDAVGKTEFIETRSLDITELKFAQQLAELAQERGCGQKYINAILSGAVLKADYKPLSEIFDEIENNKALIYHTALSFQNRSELALYRFGEIAVEQSREGKKEVEADCLDDEKLCWTMLNEKTSIIMDSDICEALDMYVNVRERETNLKCVRLSGVENSFLEIVLMDKRNCEAEKKASSKKIRLKAFFKDYLPGFMKIERNYPLILCSEKSSINKTDFANYPLWVKEYFLDGTFVSMKGEEIRRKTSSLPDDNQCYLILPFSEKSYTNLQKEHEKGSLTLEKYRMILDADDKLKAWADWIYLHQCGEERLKPADIRKSYGKLLNKIYKWMFRGH